MNKCIILSDSKNRCFALFCFVLFYKEIQFLFWYYFKPDTSNDAPIETNRPEEWHNQTYQGVKFKHGGGWPTHRQKSRVMTFCSSE